MEFTHKKNLIQKSKFAADEDDSRLAADNIYPEFVTNEADSEFAADDVSWRLATDVVVDEKHLIPDGEADNAADMEYYKQLIRNSDGEKDRENDDDENDDDDDEDNNNCSAETESYMEQYPRRRKTETHLKSNMDET